MSEEGESLEDIMEGPEAEEGQPEGKSSESNYKTLKNEEKIETNNPEEQEEVRQSYKKISRRNSNNDEVNEVQKSRINEYLAKKKSRIRDFISREGFEEDSLEKRVRISEKGNISRREEFRHEWEDPAVLWEKWTDLKGRSLWRGIKGLYHLAAALTDPGMEGREDPYKVIDELKEGDPVFFWLPGFLEVNRSTIEYEKHLGAKMIWTGTTNPDELNALFNYAIQKHGKIDAIAVFSDGGKSLRTYFDKYGDGIAKRYYAIDAHPDTYDSDKVTHIIGKNKFLIYAEKGFDYSHIPHYEVYGGHAYFANNQRTIKEVMDIIKSYQPYMFEPKPKPSKGDIQEGLFKKNLDNIIKPANDYNFHKPITDLKKVSNFS